MVNIAINGFGRIGRLVLRAGIKDPGLNFVAVNDLTDPKTLAHLFKYDSVHGPFLGTVEARGDSIFIDGKEIKVVKEKDPIKLPWKSMNIDIAVESTGFFTKKDQILMHQKAGAKKVLLSAPVKGEERIKTIVMGVNDGDYNGEDLVSNASCTTNCFAPMAKVLHDNYEIESGVMTTVHAYTNDQRILDGPHEDLRRAKAAAINIVPTTTGAAKAINEVIPSLNKRIIGSAIRVPVACGSMTHFVAEVKKTGRTVEEVNELFRNVSNYHMRGFLQYSDEPLVSSDIVGNPHSCIFDSSLTKCIDDELIEIVGWYDNEWGYSNRMCDIMRLMAKKW